MISALLFAATVATGTTATVTVGPPGSAFYVPPDPLPARRDGAVVWARRFTGGPALPSAAVNERILYDTIGTSGTFTAVSGTIAIPQGPPPAHGWPVISWAHGTVGDAPQCAPSRSSRPNIEQRMLDGFVRRGYAVAQTDYEGNGTPGIHPYFVATASARDVTDIVRAAREIDPRIGRTWIVMGHSEGGAAALATAALGEQWAPELHLAGAVAYAPASHVEGILQNEILSDAPNSGLVFLGLLIAGFSTVDPRIDPAQMLEPQALQMMPELQQRCISDLMNDSDWDRIDPRTIFRPQADEDALYADLLANSPENFSISVPTLLVQGVADALVPSEMTIALRDRLCRSGAPVAFKAYVGATHGSVLAAAAGDVAAWIARRFRGTPAHSTC
ncbi:MAG: alpha/beta hydrolase family protein [Candidatus Tyrphobacter sp.]